MSELKNLDKTHYDVVIFGQNIQSLVLAYGLYKRYNRTVAILDTDESFIPSPFLHSTPDTEINSELLKWTEELFENGSLTQQEQQQSLSVDSGKLTAFVGFGDKNFASLDLFSDFLKNSKLNFSQPLEQTLLEINELLIADKFQLATLTTINESNGKVESCRVNGSKDIKADAYVYTLPPQDIANMLLKTSAKNSEIQKISKASTWTEIWLRLTHKEKFAAEPGYHLLMGNKTDFEPCVGEFYEFNNQFCSVWASVTADQIEEDHELTGAVLRNMKKQIKRAYNEIFDSVESEKIVIHRFAQGYINWGEQAFKSVPGLENFYLCSPLFSTLSGLPAQLFAAKSCLQELVSTHQWPVKSTYSLAESEERPVI